MPKVYYAQNREDIILESFFLDKETGFYVDVGAYDPDDDSVTKLFYEKGWRGINIEPQPDRFEKFRRSRPKDTNLNVGVSDKESTLRLRSYSNEGLSTFSQEMKDEYTSAMRQDTGTTSFTDIDVQVKTLSQIFKEQKVKSIDFLKIDVEGLEYEVIAGNEWKKYRPKVLCIESNHLVRNWKEILDDNDYELVFNDGLNDYFIDSLYEKKIEFKYIDHVVLGLNGGTSVSDYLEMKHCKSANKKLQQTINGQHEFILELQNKLTKLDNVNKALQHELDQYQNIRYSASKLTSLIKRRFL